MINNKPVGLLWDSVSNNIGDKAIGLVLKAYCDSRDIKYEVINPFSYSPDDYSTIIVGGGELIRELGDPFYDCFRVRGDHILNSVGTYKPTHYEYLNDYRLVTVRTNAEKKSLEDLVPNVKVSPCLTILMEDYFPRNKNNSESSVYSRYSDSIGVHLHFGTLENMPGLISSLKELNKKFHIHFIPFTLYNNDLQIMQVLVKNLPNASISELRDPADIFHQIGSLRMMFSSSLHAAIFSYVQNVPILTFPYAPKVQDFMNERGLGKWCINNAEDLIIKTDQLLKSKVDYVKLVEIDRRSVRDHLDEMQKIIVETQELPKSFVPTAPWVEKPNGAENFHKTIMHWLATTGNRYADIQRLKFQLDHKKEEASKYENTIASQKSQLKEEASKYENTIASQKSQLKEEAIHYKRALDFKQQAIETYDENFYQLQKSIIWKLLSFVKKLNYLPHIIIDRLRYALASKSLHALFRNPLIFDADWYYSQNIDVTVSGINPYMHFVKVGWREGRNPNPFFDVSWYLRKNSDVADANLDPLFHYLTSGWKEGRIPGPFFDPSWYLENNQDVAREQTDPFTHFILFGWKEARLPSHNFYVDDYFSYYPDLNRSKSHPIISQWQNTVNDQPRVFHTEKNELNILNNQITEAFSKAENFSTYEHANNTEIVNPEVNLIAYYLPQFHPIPENDKFWGKGFTEWTNVAKARPLFEGHYQPKLPGSLGFYDLRIVEVMKQQAEMAKQFGINGFCFHYYWFNGKRVLETPIEQFYANPGIEINYCISWANENWTRKWDGHEKNILLEQTHSLKSDMSFIKSVEKFFHDPRYIKIDGKPLLLIYRPQKMSSPKKTARQWGKYGKSLGFDGLFLTATQAFGFNNPEKIGFNALVEFPPLLGAVEYNSDDFNYYTDFNGHIWDYNKLVETYENQKTDGLLFKSVIPAWDNSPRIGKKAHIFWGSSPEGYKKWLKSAIDSTIKNNKPEHRYVFINAWNEWAEGAYLEPDRKFGFAYLNATAEALNEANKKDNNNVLFVGHDAERAGAQNVFLYILRWIKKHTKIKINILLLSGGPLLTEYQELGPVLVYDNVKATNSDHTFNIIKRFCGEDIKLIYANSIVSGRIFEILKLFEIPILTHVHELEKSIENFAGYETFAKVKKYSDHYIAVSEPVKFNLIDTHEIEEDKIDLIHPFVNTYSSVRNSDAAKRYGLQPRKVIFFGCGSTDWRKGPDIFINVAKKLMARGFNNFHFYWIGYVSSENQDLLSGLKTEGLDKYVTFLGEKKNPRSYFANGDIFLMPSREDPFPLVVLEAAQCGLPTICFDGAGGIPNFVESDAGFIVPYLDENKMADKAALLLEDDLLRKKLGDRAKQKVNSRHTLESTAPKIIRTIRTIGKISPAVSIIVPCYNHANYLQQRLDSIFNQTFQDFEILLLDDASSDETSEILSRYKKLPHVEIHTNKFNSGSTFAQWKKGIQLAHSDIIWLAEDDDFCEPEFLEKMLPYFNDPNVKLAYCQSNAVDDKGEIQFSYENYTNEFSTTKWKEQYIVDANTEINAGLGVKNTIPNASAVLFRKFDLSEFESSLTGMELAGDWLFYLYAIKNGKIAFNPIQLNYHRRHDNTNIHRTRNHKKRFVESVQVQKTVLSLFKTDENTRKLMQAHALNVWQEVYPEKPNDFEDVYNKLILSNND